MYQSLEVAHMQTHDVGFAAQPLHANGLRSCSEAVMTRAPAGSSPQSNSDRRSGDCSDERRFVPP